MHEASFPESFFAELIERLPEAVLVAEPDNPYYVYVNAATRELLGYSRDEPVAFGPADVSTPESFATLPQLRSTLERTGAWHGPWDFRRKDGATVRVEAAMTRHVIRGRVLYQGLARPLPKGRAEPLPGSGAGLLEATEQAIIAATMDGRLSYWNRAAETFYGRHVLDLIPAGARREAVARMVARIQAGETVAGEMIVERPDSTRFRALVTGAPLRDADGRQVGILSMAVRVDWATIPTPSVEQQPGMRQRRALVRYEACGRDVIGTARRRYCSEKCRQWAYYHRNVEAQRARGRARHRQEDAASGEPPPDV